LIETGNLEFQLVSSHEVTTMEKILLSCRVDLDQPHAKVHLLERHEAWDFVARDMDPTVVAACEAAGLKDKADTFRVEIYNYETEITWFDIWGQKNPYVDMTWDDTHSGVRVQMNGKDIYNSLRPSDASEPGDHEDCDLCAKPE
jgi:hypothetical protein